jgi:hypothetical protein
VFGWLRLRKQTPFLRVGIEDALLVYCADEISALACAGEDGCHVRCMAESGCRCGSERKPDQVCSRGGKQDSSAAQHNQAGRKAIGYTHETFFSCLREFDKLRSNVSTGSMRDSAEVRFFLAVARNVETNSNHADSEVDLRLSLLVNHL